MESIALTPEERKSLIRKMKRETQPSRRLRMHIVLLVADDHSPSEIARTLYCSRTTVYTVVRRFLEEGEAAFADRKRRGPRPRLTEWPQAGRRSAAPCSGWASSGEGSGLCLPLPTRSRNGSGCWRSSRSSKS